MNQEVRSSSTNTIKLGSQRKGKCKQVATQGSQGSSGVLFHVAPRNLTTIQKGRCLYSPFTDNLAEL